MGRRWSNSIIRQGLLLLGTTFAVGFAEPILKVIPISSQITSQRTESVGGVFMDTPQTILVWGIIYYSIDTYLDIKYTLKSRSKQ